MASIHASPLGFHNFLGRFLLTYYAAHNSPAIMIKGFKDRAALQIFEGRSVKRRAAIEHAARKRLKILDAATSLRDLSALPGNRLEALKGNRKRRYTVRIDDQWRICFAWTTEGNVDVEITDYH